MNLEKDLMIFKKELLITKTEKDKDVWIVTGLTNTTYTFLQNINRLKSALMKHGYTFKPIMRLTEFSVVMQIVKR